MAEIYRIYVVAAVKSRLNEAFLFETVHFPAEMLRVRLKNDLKPTSQRNSFPLLEQNHCIQVMPLSDEDSIIISDKG